MAFHKLCNIFSPVMRISFARSTVAAASSRPSLILCSKTHGFACFSVASSNIRFSGFPAVRNILNVQVSMLSTCKSLSREAGGDLPHFKDRLAQDVDEQSGKENKSYVLPHPIWSEKDLYSVEVTHKKPETWVDEMAYVSVQILRVLFDVFSMYNIGRMTEDKWLIRIIMLETIAGVPGMVAAMVRHFNSLRRMSRDHGWIHTLLEDAENERMHLMTYLELKDPGKLFRFTVILAQGVAVNMLFLAYLISPKFVHRLVGYLEEEAVKTYTYCLECLDNDKLPMWNHLKAPVIAKNYWKLGDNAMIRDVILATRADEAHHRLINHTMASMPYDKQNPFMPGEKKL